MYLIVYVVLVHVWGLRDVMYLNLYFLPLELPEKEDYGHLWAINSVILGVHPVI